MIDRPTLKLYSRRPEATAELVQLLAARGYAVDARVTPHRIGQSIVNAVKRFQAQHLDMAGYPLAVDGIVGPLTWGALLRPDTDDQRTGLGGEPGSYPDPRIPCSPASDVGRFLAACLDHYDLGVREVPMGSNRVPELEARAQGKPWCSFWAHDRIKAIRGEWIFPNRRRGSTQMDLKTATSEGRIVPEFAERPGDVFLLTDENGRPYHTGVVLRIDAPGINAGEMDTVEGNCANRVAVRRRNINDDLVFWRPCVDDLEWSPGLLPGPVKHAGGESTR